MAMRTAVAGRAAGLTLIEVLATVFVLGMGLIMVGAAFPVGLDQTRRTMDDTRAAQLARSVAEVIRNGNPDYLRTAGTASAAMNAGVWPYNAAAVDFSNSAQNGSLQRMAYSAKPADDFQVSYVMQSWDDKLIATGQSGDLICYPVVTRLADPMAPSWPSSVTSKAPVVALAAQAPLLRLTLVVCRGGYSSPTSTNISPKATLTNPPALAPGDCVMTPDGLCYHAVTVAGNGIVTLDMLPAMSGIQNCVYFYNVVGVFYTYISG